MSNISNWLKSLLFSLHTLNICSINSINEILLQFPAFNPVVLPKAYSSNFIKAVKLQSSYLAISHTHHNSFYICLESSDSHLIPGVGWVLTRKLGSVSFMAEIRACEFYSVSIITGCIVITWIWLVLQSDTIVVGLFSIVAMRDPFTRMSITWVVILKSISLRSGDNSCSKMFRLSLYRLRLIGASSGFFLAPVIVFLTVILVRFTPFALTLIF